MKFISNFILISCGLFPAAVCAGPFSGSPAIDRFTIIPGSASVQVTLFMTAYPYQIANVQSTIGEFMDEQVPDATIVIVTVYVKAAPFSDNYVPIIQDEEKEKTPGEHWSDVFGSGSGPTMTGGSGSGSGTNSGDDGLGSLCSRVSCTNGSSTRTGGGWIGVTCDGHGVCHVYTW
ncbi:MAG TPA: hypothetical protein VFM15_02580 [Gammaproteobacteria bacterium]|nr:hypothetical protein [Gammaproteobacteria bacterium]